MSMWGAVRWAAVAAVTAACLTACADAARTARLQRARATFAEALGAGSPLPVAACRGVAELAAVREFSAAWALAEAVRRMPGGDAAGTAADAVLLHRRGQHRVRGRQAG